MPGTKLIIMLIATEAGFRVGIWLQDRKPDDSESRMTGTVVGGMLGLMAFLMAFSIGIVINQQSGRKAMVVEEANAIGTAWLRAGFLDEADKNTARALLQEYAEVRLGAAEDPETYPAAITRSEEIHGELWAIMEDLVNIQGYDTDVTALVIESINDVIDVHALRITAANLRLPNILGFVLFVATVLSFLLVGVSTSADRKRDTAAMVLYALAFIAVLIIIVDLDRPQSGILTVSQAAMADLLASMQDAGQ